MSIYIFLFVFFLFGILKGEIYNRKKSNFLIFLLIFLFCFTYKMGSDWLAYQDFYENIVGKLSIENIFQVESGFEVGYIVLNIIFQRLGFNYEIFAGVVLGASSFIILKFIQKKSKNYYLAFFIFFVQFFLAALVEPVARQVVAVAFFVISLKYIEKRNFCKYLVIILFAAQFHKSAYFLLPLYFVEYIKIGIKKMILSLFLLKGVLEFLFPFILFFFPKYYGYIHSMRYIGREKIGIIGIMMILFYLFTLFYIYDKFHLRKEKKIFNFSIIFIFVYVTSMYFPIFSRINLYFAPFICIVISYVGELKLKYLGINILFKGKTKNIFMVSTVFMMFVMMFHRKISSSELTSFVYLNYKNYIIEFLKGDLDKNFVEKSGAYRQRILELRNKER